jgi:pimeloyl-ACP methyl ester carboxylesterase
MSTFTVEVPHIGGVSVGCQLAPGLTSIDSSKPTLVMIHSFGLSTWAFRSQFADERLKSKFNLIAFDSLGHGQTRARVEHWTYWDSAWIFLQAMDSLGIFRAFVLGSSQGGWQAARMALLAPDRVS